MLTGAGNHSKGGILEWMMKQAGRHPHRLLSFMPSRVISLLLEVI